MTAWARALPDWLLPVLVAGATWSGWRWYIERISTAPDEAIALLLAMVFLAAAGVASRRDKASGVAPDAMPAIILAIVLALYAVGYDVLPGIARAALAVAATLHAIHWAALRTRPPVAFWGLVALALPVLPSLQFTFGYPLRAGSAEATAGLLRAQGLAVERQGTFLLWQGQTLQFDAPCSGLNMLWAGLLVACMACVWLRLNVVRTAAALAVAVAAVLAANVLRATSLFYVEAGLIPGAPAWWHEGIGIVAFAAASAATLAAISQLAPAQGLEDRRL
jgi:exosortase/archaeosortase family protein